MSIQMFPTQPVIGRRDVELTPETQFPFHTPETWLAENTSHLHVDEYVELSGSALSTAALLDEEEFFDFPDYWGLLSENDMYEARLRAESYRVVEEQLLDEAEESWGLLKLGYTYVEHRNYRFGHRQTWTHDDAAHVPGFGTPTILHTLEEDCLHVVFDIVGSDDLRAEPIWSSGPVSTSNITPAILEAETYIKEGEALAVLLSLTRLQEAW